MSLMNSSLIVGDLNIAQLSDSELAKCLMEQGFNPGPIIASTRSVYERKLARLLRNESFLENEENGLDAEVLPNPILSSTMRESPAPTPTFQPPSPPAFQSNNYDIDFDDLRRRPLPRLDNSYSPSYESWRRPTSPDDIVSQATPPPPEPESPMLSPLVKLILLVVAVIFVVFVYYNMEATPDNPFTSPPDTSA